MLTTSASEVIATVIPDTSAVNVNHTGTKDVVTNTNGEITTTSKCMTNLQRAAGLLVGGTKLDVLCVGEMKKVVIPTILEINHVFYDLENEGFPTVGVYDVDGPNAGNGVAGLAVSLSIDKGMHSITLTFKVDVDPPEYQFNLSIYGKKKLVVKWRTTEVYSEIVLFKPAVAVRPPASFVFHNAKNGTRITARGHVLVSSRADPRSTQSSPVFPEVRLPYDGSTTLKLPSNLPDSVITVTPELPGFSNKVSDKLVLFGGASGVDPAERQVNLSPSDLLDTEWRVVLSWGEEPRDLDLYCKTNFKPELVYYSAKNKGGSKNPEMGMIELDKDITTGKGPETITFTPMADKKYRFYVHNFSGSRGSTRVPLSSSSAKIVVFKGDGDSRTYS
eukprot:CAMPEP_0201093174 /NCGR_PEP_ID=MMETSP0812-20130820/1738_1 /ASSEMBLY_ACC=CAM_ASM_000668 /TAXON_ID=98059 /ORGANISM="Dinobryon sp., Strain UTEXLB2267" /LENGTH=388 /DNA_ID=CAMNT_0047345221 /DNA_START=2002 /DNA_END=3165 /DNA_ORIENTATION=+